MHTLITCNQPFKEAINSFHKHIPIFYNKSYKNTLNRKNQPMHFKVKKRNNHNIYLTYSDQVSQALLTNNSFITPNLLNATSHICLYIFKINSALLISF